MKYLLLSVLLCTAVLSSAQTPAIKWQATYGGSSTDNLNGMVPTPGGGCIAAGAATSTNGYVTGNHGGQDIWVTKIDANGNLQWQKSYGGSLSDACFEISATNDGGYVVAGRSASSDGDVALNKGSDDYWIFKIDGAGNLLWEKTYGGSQSEMARSCVQAPDGNYYVMGSTNSTNGDVTGNHGNGDFWVLKLDTLGNLIWQKALGGSGAELGWRVQPTADGGALTIGTTASTDGDVVSLNHGSYDIWIVKLDSSGNIHWEKCYGGSAGDDGNSISLTSDGGFLASGHSASTNGDLTSNYGAEDIWLIKADSVGNIQWQKSFGGSGQDWSIDTRQTANGEYLISGRTGSSDNDVSFNHGGNDAWAAKLDASANLIWERSFGGSAHDEGKDFVEISPGEYIFSSFTTSIDGDVVGNNGSYDYWVLRLTKDYNRITGKTFLDFNSNQLFDGSDIPLAHHKVTETSTGRLAFSDLNGNYNLTVIDTGTFTVESDTVQYFAPQPAALMVNFPAFSLIDSLNNFAHAPTIAINDVQVNLTPLGAFRPGRKAYYGINYANTGTSFINGIIRLMPDTILTYDSASVAPATINADTITWNLGLLAPFQSGYFYVRLLVDSAAMMDSSLITQVMIEPVTGDAVTADNFDAWQSLITTSYDPNNKLVNDEVISVNELSSAPWLDYVINFQNTGNDTAFVIHVHDTIPLELNMQTFEFISSSHNVVLNYDNDTRLMDFEFDNILLPDSTTNEARSHGFVHFRIKPITTLSAGTWISNTAHIFFDLNAPVTTNSAVTAITTTSGLSSITQLEGLLVYPNPADDVLFIQWNGNSSCRLLITDITGRVVDALQNVNGPLQINTSNWKSGMYFITALDGKNSYCVKVLKN